MAFHVLLLTAVALLPTLAALLTLLIALIRHQFNPLIDQG